MYWRSLPTGKWRDMVRLPPDIATHSDAVDVGYSVTLGYDERGGLPGLYKGQGLLEVSDRAEPITSRELRAVRFLLQQHFSEYVSHPRVRRLLVHEDNSAVLFVLNAMFSAPRPMMVDCGKLEVLLWHLGVRVKARWMLRAANCFAYAL